MMTRSSMPEALRKHSPRLKNFADTLGGTPKTSSASITGTPMTVNPLVGIRTGLGASPSNLRNRVLKGSVLRTSHPMMNSMED